MWIIFNGTVQWHQAHHTVVQISQSSVSQIFHFLNYILFSQLLPLWTIHLQYVQVVSLCLGLSIGSVHAQSCLTLCDPMDCSLPGPSVHGVFQARMLEWVAISYSRRSSQPRDQGHVSCIGRQILYHCATWEAPIRCFFLHLLVSPLESYWVVELLIRESKF